MIVKVVLCVGCWVLMAGCITPQGRALREASNIYFSKRLATYCEKPKNERDVYASALNRRLHFTGAIRIVCPGEGVNNGS